jgi:hypothetical protein
MISHWIALAGAVVVTLGVTGPATGLASTSGNVRNLDVSKVGKDCLRVEWAPPVDDNKQTYGVVIRTRRGDEMYRVETYETHTKMCKLNAKKYRVQVKQYGGTWVRAAVRLG